MAAAIHPGQQLSIRDHPALAHPHAQRLVYEDTQGDEVEDLAALLAYIKQRHPEVTAVASGAIASGGSGQQEARSAC